MKEIGKMINRMVKAKKPGPMAQHTKAAIREELSTARAIISGQTKASITATGKITPSAVLVSTSGLMVADMKELGEIIICMGKVFIPGETVENTMVNIRMIRSMGMEFILGPMEDNTMVSG